MHANAAQLIATFAPDCTAAGDSLDCHLDSILHILYAVAIVLGLAFIIIAIAAYAVYRRNRTARLAPDQEDQNSR